MSFDTKLTPKALAVVLITIALIATDLAADAYVYATHHDPLWHEPLHNAVLLSVFLINWQSARSPTRQRPPTRRHGVLAKLCVCALVLAAIALAIHQAQGTITGLMVGDSALGIVLITLLYGLRLHRTLPPAPPLPETSAT